MRQRDSFSEQREIHSAECGAEIVSHALVQVLVLVLVSAILQLGFAFYSRNVAVDAASEAARYLSLQNASTDSARQRVNDLLQASLGRPAREVIIREEQVGKLQVVRVEVGVDLPVLGPWGIPNMLRVGAQAWRVP